MLSEVIQVATYTPIYANIMQMMYADWRYSLILILGKLCAMEVKEELFKKERER